MTKPYSICGSQQTLTGFIVLFSWRTQFIGTVALPVIAGEVSGAVVQDAVADAYCWQIIGAFLGETIYSGLRLQVSDGRTSVHRNGLHLATWQSTIADARSELHDRVGWTVFLQELWGRYDWDSLSILPKCVGATGSAFFVGLREAATEVVSSAHSIRRQAPDPM